ncbi:SOS response-associated peptidase [Paenibacillus doosanensis]|uniref:Abasic site processing protein n=1 Tax=Paenibacillus konkukensis TaxID=2020716 RepID=A0ABY4RX71_9BACL|nr:MULTISPECIES: SOS response-associated peptidase family protein [Paenibacillus]MCS7459483.1 SOS response-associated peptidase [Paenibacillus doosanensis]UQZ87279.1 hypothetical protein SK3146_06576 [Paenibacillus konkukensis]
MCDRFTLHAELSDLQDRYGLSKALFYYANQRSLQPQQPIAAVVVQHGERILDEYRWGLMPFWAQDSIVADSASVFGKRAFDHLLKRQRCIIPGSSFDKVYRPNAKEEQVSRFIIPGGQTFAMAGVYDVWSGSFGEQLRTCAILTRKVRNFSTGLEDTVPLILNEEQVDTWLDPGLFNKQLLREWLHSTANPPLCELPTALWDRAGSWDETDLDIVAVPYIAER